jgi:fatty-acyl-CoA synthase
MSVLSAPSSFRVSHDRADAPRRPLRLRLGRAYLNLAIVLALAPAILMLVAAAGVGGGLMRWDAGFGYAAASVAPMIAFASIGTGLIALIVAVVLGLGRFWLRALLALAVSAATMAGYVASQADVLSAQPSGPQLRV